MRHPGELRHAPGRSREATGRPPRPPTSAARTAAACCAGMRLKSFSLALALSWASQSASTSATSRADWKRSAGFLACSLAMMSHSHCGVSGMISRIGRGVSSATRFRTASVPFARNGGRPADHRVEHAAEAEQVGPVVERLPLGLLRGHVHRRAGDDAALREAGVVGGAGQAEVGDLHLVLPAFEQDVGRLDVAVDQVAWRGRRPAPRRSAGRSAAPPARRAGRSGRAAAGASRRG